MRNGIINPIIELCLFLSIVRSCTTNLNLNMLVLRNSIGLFLAIIATFPSTGSAIYFSQKIVDLQLSSIPENAIVYFAQVILEPDETGTILFSIKQNNKGLHCPQLFVNENGNVQVYSLGDVDPDKTNFWTCKYSVTAKLEGQVGIRGKKEAQMTLNLTRKRNHEASAWNCSMLSKEELCFGGSRDLTAYIMENSMELPLLYLITPNPGLICENWNVTFDVVSEDDVVFIRKSSSSLISPLKLWVKGSLDREEKDSYTFNITCELEEVSDGRVEQYLVPGKLYVIDQNDNPPTVEQEKQIQTVHISLRNKTNSYEPNTRLIQDSPEHLLIKDKDTVGVQSFNLSVINDPRNLLNITFKTVEATHNPPKFTVIMPTISLSSYVNHSDHWTGLYCAKAVFNDQKYQGNKSSKFTYNICIHWGDVNIHELPDDYDPDTISNSYTNLTFDSQSNVSNGSFGGTSDIADQLNSSCGLTCKITFIVVATCLITIPIVMVIQRARVSQRRKSRTIKRNLMSIGSRHGENGNTMVISEMEYIGPTASLDNGNSNVINTPLVSDFEMVDSKWEISRNLLVREYVLGEGEFGTVWKGKAFGLEGNEGWMPVAVKMLKDNHEETGKSCRQEFLAEFSLLTLVDHPNVIKLLGACTTPGGPLYLVLEYAEFGSLRSFLRKCRRVESLTTETEGRVPIENTVDLLDYTVTPQELLRFSWQIAKGMTYLSNMKMVHRDLAARNILLTGSKMCKISDFGLTRDIYVDEAYQKKSRDRVPVKWLAPECLADELYTAKSDVWSFGILLWELATLGASPYPGIQSERLYSLLKQGYRMPQPENCSMEFYSIMRQCWANDPKNRPTFRQLDCSISNLLENGIEYLKLDMPLVSNPGYDYFSNTDEISPTRTFESLDGRSSHSDLIDLASGGAIN